MKEGQYVRHVRNPEYGIGKVEARLFNGACKVVFPHLTINGVLPHALEALSLVEQKQVEKEEAMRAGPEALAAWEKKQTPPQIPNQAHCCATDRTGWRYGGLRRARYYDAEDERLSKLLEAAMNDPRSEGRPVGQQGDQQADSSWWYQSFRLNKAADEDLSMETRVVGVTYENRQSVIASMEENEQVLLVREPENPVDANAVSVKRINGRQIGYLPRELAAKAAARLDALGKPVCAVVTAILGRHYIDGTLGVRIRFSLAGIEQGAENGIATGEDNELPPF